MTTIPTQRTPAEFLAAALDARGPRPALSAVGANVESPNGEEATMTTATTHRLDDPTTLPAGPSSVQIEGLHLRITQEWASGSTHNLHLVENGDLNVILSRGGGNDVPSGETGTVVVSLGVDEDHDEVHYIHRSAIDAEEAIGQAIEALVASRHALARIRKVSA